MITSLSRLPEQPLFANRTPYDFNAGDPRGLQHLSLEQQKKRAKELLKQWRSRQPDAVSRAKRVFSSKALADFEGLKLSDALHVIAREFHFTNWPDLKIHIEQTHLARKAIENSNPTSLDADVPTLHIRCGTDIRHALVTLFQ